MHLLKKKKILKKFHNIRIKITLLTPQTRELLIDEVGQVSKYKNIGQNNNTQILLFC